MEDDPAARYDTDDTDESDAYSPEKEADTFGFDEDVDYRDVTEPLDYPGRDIRIIMDTWGRGGPVIFGDFDPNRDDPDPAVWPVEEVDPGAGDYTVDDLILMINETPAPHVAWLTPDYYKSIYGKDPGPPDFSRQEIASLKQEVSESPPGRMELTQDRMTALERAVRIWNGEEVRGAHLVVDKCPRWETLFGDLDQKELERLSNDPTVSDSLSEAFGGMRWFDDGTTFFAQQRILKTRPSYAPTPAAKKLVNGTDDLPDFRGDQLESLNHRFLVLLVAAYYNKRGWRVGTYQNVDRYNVDVLATMDGDIFDRIEVMTGHNNMSHHSDTYSKLKRISTELSVRGNNIAVFPSRETAIDLFNYWIRNGLAELPTGTFDTDPSIDWTRNKIQEAAADPNIDWVIDDFLTTHRLWRLVGGDEGELDKSDFKSEYW